MTSYSSNRQTLLKQPVTRADTEFYWTEIWGPVLPAKYEWIVFKIETWKLRQCRIHQTRIKSKIIVGSIKVGFMERLMQKMFHATQLGTPASISLCFPFFQLFLPTWSLCWIGTGSEAIFSTAATSEGIAQLHEGGNCIVQLAAEGSAAHRIRTWVQDINPYWHSLNGAVRSYGSVNTCFCLPLLWIRATVVQDLCSFQRPLSPRACWCFFRTVPVLCLLLLLAVVRTSANTNFLCAAALPGVEAGWLWLQVCKNLQSRKLDYLHVTLEKQKWPPACMIPVVRGYSATSAIAAVSFIHFESSTLDVNLRRCLPKQHTISSQIITLCFIYLFIYFFDVTV